MSVIKNFSHYANSLISSENMSNASRVIGASDGVFTDNTSDDPWPSVTVGFPDVPNAAGYGLQTITITLRTTDGTKNNGLNYYTINKDGVPQPLVDWSWIMVPDGYKATNTTSQTLRLTFYGGWIEDFTGLSLYLNLYGQPGAIPQIDSIKWEGSYLDKTLGTIVSETKYMESFISNSGDTMTNPDNALGSPDGTFTSSNVGERWRVDWKAEEPSARLLPIKYYPMGKHDITVRARKSATGANNVIDFFGLYEKIGNDYYNYAYYGNDAPVNSTTGEDVKFPIAGDFFDFFGNTKNGFPETLSFYLEGGEAGLTGGAAIEIDSITWECKWFVPNTEYNVQFIGM